jgi:1-acyl-sn-glycerol-3-phosphate acyltransferase
MDRLAFIVRFSLTVVLMCAGALGLLLIACVTGFQCPRLYRETVAARLGRMALALWGIRMHVHGGLPQPDAGGQVRQVVYVSNHSSTIDLFVLLALALPNTRFFLSGYLRKIVPIGLIGYLIGIFWTVPQEYPEQRRQIFMRADRVLRASGESVYLSPEGMRVTSGEIGHFNRGAFHLATALGAPIIPLYIRIPKASDPGRGLDAKPGDVDVFVGQEIETRHWRVEDVDTNKEQVRDFYIDWHRQRRDPGVPDAKV